MIRPDDKNWTWVIDRPCPECGFDASTCEAVSVAALVRDNAAEWLDLLARGRIAPGRSDPTRWSSLEYAAHVRDVYVRYDARIALMQSEADPVFANWDQDASAVDDRYDDQDPGEVIDALIAAADALADRLDALAPPEWERTGRRSDGASFTIATISRYMVHDTIHHVWDLTEAG